MDFKHRILLKTQSALYVVAVGDGVKDIHTDWQFIEQNMFRQIMNMEEGGELDEFLLARFREMTRQLEDSPGLPGKLEKIQDHNAVIKKLFKVDEVLLSCKRVTMLLLYDYNTHSL